MKTMKRLIKQTKGQFVIIAVLTIAIMIISIGALMHRAVTYYKHEPWEEYLALTGNVELNAHRLIELSLANYTQLLPQGNISTESTPQHLRTILKENLDNWQSDLLKMYPGREIAMVYTLAANTAYNYSLGLAHSWNQSSSFSAVNASFHINLTSVGLAGYQFTATEVLTLRILTINVSTNEIYVTVKGQDDMPLFDLTQANFQVDEPNNITITSVASLYNDEEMLIYTIRCDQLIQYPVAVTVCDERGIKVTATLEA
jgi:hypothetical protein